MAIRPANPAREVQSLGRADVGAPLAIANAVANAAQYEGRGLMALGRGLDEVRQVVQQRVDQHAVDELNEQWLLAQAEAVRAMEAIRQPTMRADDPGLEGLEFQRTLRVAGPAGATEVELRDVPTYEIGGEYLTRRLEAIREAASENISDGRARKQFAAKWALREAELHVEAAGIMREARMADLRGSYQHQVESALQLDDEDSARSVANQAFAMRVINGQELAAELKRISERIDLQHYSRALGRTDTQAGLEALIQEVEEGLIVDPATGSRRQARATPDQLWAIRQQANAKLGQLDQARARRYDEGHRAAVAGLLEGSLTRGKLRALVASDAIAPGTAAALAESLRVAANRAPASSPGLKDAFLRRINSIWAVGEGQTVTGNADALRAQLTMAAHGVDPKTGLPTPGAPRLTGDDFGELMTALNTVVRRIDDDPRFKQADDVLRAASAVGPAGSAWMGDASQIDSLRAYNAGRVALTDYINTAGMNADPLAWARENRDIFDAKNYAAKTVRDFMGTRSYATIGAFVPADPGTEVTREVLVDALAHAQGIGAVNAEIARVIYDQLHGLDGPAFVVPGAEQVIKELPPESAPFWRRLPGASWFFDDEAGAQEVKPGAEGVRP